MPLQERDRWGTRAVFLLAAIGSAVGLGNIWRFPYVVHSAGGGAFFIPYFLALFTAGIPLLMLEFGMGHRMQGSAPAAFGKVNRKWEFVGWWAVLGGLMITFYYTIIMAWICTYIVDLTGSLFSGKLPWEAGMAEQYLNTRVLTGDGSIKAETGKFLPLNWLAIGFNALVWLAIYYSIRDGVKSVGKVVWFSVLSPYVLLAILFINSVGLEGSSAGLSYYLSPDWSQFSDFEKGARVFSAAYGQMFFSLSIGFGIMIAYASYLPKKSDLANNAVITAYANSATEFFAGFITFSVLGFLALQKGVFTGDAIGSGSFSMALVSYPTAIENLPFLFTWKVLFGLSFFVCLLVLGVDSAFTLADAMIAGIHDKFSVSRRAVTKVFCIGGWIIGVIFCNPSGLDLLGAADRFLSDYGLLLVGLLQCVFVGWVYGPAKMRSHINMVSEKRITVFWDFCIKYLTPAILLIILFFQVKDDVGKMSFDGPGGIIIICGMAIMPLCLILALVLSKRKPDKHEYTTMPEFDYGKK